MANHFGLNFDLVELLTGVDTDDGADHFGDNDHVTEVGFDEVGLLVGAGLLLRLAELLDETHGLALQAAVEPSAGTGVDDITELFRRKVEEPELSMSDNTVSNCDMLPSVPTSDSKGDNPIVMVVVGRCRSFGVGCRMV